MMTPCEFKAWFEGFTESLDGPPSLKQWERIQARVKQITGAPTSYPVFVDRYWPAIQLHQAKPWWMQNNPTCAANTLPNGLVTSANVASLTAETAAIREGVNYTTLQAGHCDGGVGRVAFDSHSAMNALGKADAEALAA